MKRNIFIYSPLILFCILKYLHNFINSNFLKIYKNIRVWFLWKIVYNIKTISSDKKSISNNYNMNLTALVLIICEYAPFLLWICYFFDELW